MRSISTRDRWWSTLRMILISQSMMAAWLCLLNLPDLFPVLKQEPWPFLLFSLSFRAVIVIATLVLVFAPAGGFARLPRPEPGNPKRAMIIALYGLAGAMALAHIASLLALPLDRLVGRVAAGAGTGGHNVWEWPWTLRLLNTSLGAPITEELIFRLYVYGHVRVTLGRRWALVLSTALFTFWHWDALPSLFMGRVPESLLSSAPSLLVGIAAAGFMNALIYEAAGVIWAPIMAHGLYNLVVLLPLQGWIPRLVLGLLGGIALTAWVYRPAWLQPIQRWLPGHLARFHAPEASDAASQP